MDAMLNKSQKNKGVAESSLADTGRSEVNDAGTGSKIDTPLTQPRSGPVRYGCWQPMSTYNADEHGKVLVWCDEGIDVAEFSEREGDGPDSMGHDAGWWGTLQPMDPGRHMGNPEYFREAESQPWAWMPLPDAPYDDEGERLFP